MESEDDCPESPPNSIAIVGGGFTGAVLAAELLHQGDRSLSVVVIERTGKRGRGVAYGTENNWHLLNVPASNMSALAADPEHFVRWSRANYDHQLEPGSFLPRPLYARYIEAVVDEAARLHPGQLRWISGDACALERETRLTRIVLRGGGEVLADKVILASGNFPVSDPELPGKARNSPRYISDAWSEGSTQGVALENSILLVGTGLTAVDVAISLRAANFRGTIHMLSRRGLVPHRHQSHPAREIVWKQPFPQTARGLTRMIREQVKTTGVNWRPIIDSLRPFTQPIWRSLPHPERLRFLRHLRPFWESHRHRIAPKVGSLLEEQLRTQQIQIHTGRLRQYSEDEGGIDVSYAERRSGKIKCLRVDRVINCTGPETDCRKVRDAFFAHLLKHGFMAPDRLLLGFDATEDGALINSQGKASKFLYAVGPPRKGSLWEATAVPEIRSQVAGLVAHLLRPGAKADASDPKAEMAGTAGKRAPSED
jgi:uncharacterized NAD(P)/FAD-binding protein YdhS